MTGQKSSKDPANWYWCSPCQKRGYVSRRLAKRCEKDLVRKGDKTSLLDVFACRAGRPYWHVGHNNNDLEASVARHPAGRRLPQSRTTLPDART